MQIYSTFMKLAFEIHFTCELAKTFFRGSNFRENRQKSQNLQNFIFAKICPNKVYLTVSYLKNVS